MKIAFVGVKRAFDRNAFMKISAAKRCPTNFFEDFEKAKQWVLP